MIQALVFVGAGMLAFGVIFYTLWTRGDRILNALEGRPALPPARASEQMRRVWSVPRERLPVATRHAGGEFLPVRGRR